MPQIKAVLGFLRVAWPYVTIAALVMLALWLNGERIAADRRTDNVQAAFDATVERYRTATAQAQANDLANVVRATGQQSTITKETTDDYAARIDELRRDYALRLQRGEGAVSASGGDREGVPKLSDAARRVDEGACKAPVFPLEDAKLASEQAEQLIALQGWVKRQAEVKN